MNSREKLRIRLNSTYVQVTMVAISKVPTRTEVQPLRGSSSNRSHLEIDNSSNNNNSNENYDRASHTYAMASKYNPVRMFKTCLFFFGSLFILDKMDVYHTLLHSSRIRRVWLHTAMALSLAMLLIKSYVELYQGKTKKVPVTYQNFRQATHAIIVMFILTSISLHVALWPVYGGPKTFLIGICIGYGIVLQVMLILPVYAQNFIGMVLLMFMVQQYV